MAVVLALAVVVGSLIAVLAVQRERALSAGLIATGVNLCLIPSFSPPATVSALSVGGCLVVLALAAGRCSTRVHAIAVPRLLVAYVLYNAFTMTWNIGLLRSAQQVTGAALLLAIVFGLCRCTQPERARVAAALVALVAVQAVLVSTEAFAGAEAVWPRPNGANLISHRPNRLLPGLAGRALGSTAGPIPLGTLAGVAIVIATWWVFTCGDRRYWWGVAAGGLTLLCSGTRSAMVALLVVGAIWLVSQRGFKSTKVLALGASVLALTTTLGGIQRALGFEGFGETQSYQHRAGVLRSFGALIDERSVTAIFFGSGGTGARELFLTGVMQTDGNSAVFDQQFVRAFAVSGLIGLFLLVGFLAVAFARGDLLSRLCLTFLVCMFFSFDALTWNLTTFLVLLFAVGPIAPTAGEPVSTEASRDGSRHSRLRGDRRLNMSCGECRRVAVQRNVGAG